MQVHVWETSRMGGLRSLQGQRQGRDLENRIQERQRAIIRCKMGRDNHRDDKETR